MKTIKGTISINMNINTRVKLTDKGKMIASLASVSEYDWVNADELGVPLWKLFQIFGEHLHMGCDIPFKQNEIILKNS